MSVISHIIPDITRLCSFSIATHKSLYNPGNGSWEGVRGLRGGYCEGGFGVKTNALIVRLSVHDEVHPTHNLNSKRALLNFIRH